MKLLLKHHHLQTALFFIYIVTATLIMIIQGIGITPDRYIIILLVAALFLHRGRQFIKDFSPFLFIIISYDFLRGFADDIAGHIHYMEPIQVTRLMFGGNIPSIELQKMLYTAGQLHWYDYFCTLLYLIHFAAPLAFAFFLWLSHRKRFEEFMLGIVFISYAGFLSYLIYPTSPPWLAAKLGYLPPVTKIFNVVLQAFPEKFQLPTLYHFIGSNLVAAIPSMHAAYPTLMLLYGIRFFGKKGWLFLPYAMAMWFTIVYLGEHYVVDILVGVVYALVIFMVTKIIMKNYHHIFTEAEIKLGVQRKKLKKHA